MNNRINEAITVYNNALADNVITDEEKEKLNQVGITEELVNELSGKNQDEAACIINGYFGNEPKTESAPWYVKLLFTSALGGITGAIIGSQMKSKMKCMKKFGLIGAGIGLTGSLIEVLATKKTNKTESQKQAIKVIPEEIATTEPQDMSIASENKDSIQKNKILSIMNIKENCWNESKDDLDKIADKIIKYTNANNPKAELERYAKESKSERVRKLAQQMLDEGFADNFAVFAASIVAKESKFLEKSTENHEINTEAGKGMFQLTESILKDFINDHHIAKKCIDPDLKNKYKTSEEFLKAAAADPEINYQAGIAGLNYKLFSILEKMENNENWNIPGGKNTPTTLLEYTAYKYNGNHDIQDNAEKEEDKDFEICDNYARDVIETFIKANKDDLDTSKYFKCTGYKDKDGTRIGQYKLVKP